MDTPEKKGALGLFMSMSLVIGTMVGSGIYFLPSSLAPLGWNTVLGWVISGAGAICLAASFRFLMDGTGEGIQHNTERVIGEIPSFLGLFAYWAAGFTSIAALTIAGGSIFVELFFDDAQDEMGVIVALILTWAITAVNLSGTRSAGRLQVLSVAIKLIPLVLVIGAMGWVLTGPAPLQPIAPSPINADNISGAVALTLFALLGFEAASIPVNKISNPGRNIPIALIGGTLLVVVLYLLTTTGIVMVMPWQDIASSTSPVSDTLTAIMGPVAGTLVALCIFVSVVGCANGLILIGADCTYSMALRREVPQFFARNNRHEVPYWGVLVQGIWVTVLILANTSRGLSGMFTYMALLTTGGVLVFYLTGVVAAIKENRKASRWPVLLGGFAFAVFATYGSGLETSLWVIVLLAAALVIRWICRRAGKPPIEAEAA